MTPEIKRRYSSHRFLAVPIAIISISPRLGLAQSLRPVSSLTPGISGRARDVRSTDESGLRAPVHAVVRDFAIAPGAPIHPPDLSFSYRNTKMHLPTSLATTNFPATALSILTS